ncbi:MAG: holo-[acyl-carrier-protein] synthase [Fusobacteriales bacterium]|nr:MAG: holo-[acyl-carrier-protein] synthase [Fusobacteriales bacterium]
MIYGIGNDIIEIERIEKAISKNNFKEKVFTEKERDNILSRGNRVESYAGIFSAKEAISKASGEGVRNFSLLDIEILNDEKGKPYVALSKKLDELIKNKFGEYRIEISISHSKTFATAIAIIFKIS